jgi:hypothetical protein
VSNLRDQRQRWTSAVAALAGLAGLLAASAVRAQMGHGLPPPGRPLHVRLAQADVVAIAAVERVETGRIALRDVHALRGAPGEQFEIKRAPSRAPALAEGDQALFLLAGARAPYVLVDEPREILRLPDADQRERWRAALESLLAAGDDLAGVRDAYLAWIDGNDDALREAATRALTDRRANPIEVPSTVSLQRAAIALDARRPEAVRRASASVASVEPAGVAALLAGLARADVDPGVAQIALAAGGLQRAPGLAAGTARAVAHANPEVRRAGLALAGWFAGDPSVRAAIERAAKSDPDPSLRAAAERALADAARP